MGDVSNNHPPSDPFVLQLARRQYEEARRRAALLARFSGGQPPASTYEALQRPMPSSGVAGAQGLHPLLDQPGRLGSSLQQVDDATPLQLSPPTPPGRGSEPGSVGPHITGDGLLNTAGGAGIAALGAAGLAGLPEDIPVILGALGLLGLGTILSTNQSEAPPLGGSTRRPLGGFPGLPLPKPALPPATPPIVGRPAPGSPAPGSTGSTDVGKGVAGPVPTPVPPTILTGPDLVGKTLADMILEYNPYGSRGNPLTQLSNNIVIQECMKAAADRLPELTHIGGGSVNGKEGGTAVPETSIPGLRGDEFGRGKLSGNKSDVSFDLATNKEVSTHINTTSMRKDGKMTSVERAADERLAKNLKRFRDRGVRKYTIRKLTPGDDVDAFRAEAGALCQKMIDDLKKEMANAPQGAPTMQDPAPE